MQLVKSEGMNEFTELQEVIIGTLKTFHDFCKEHNLTYHLGGGTLLGAVRHKGIIPWDDDIDVDMPREDYEKFLTLAKRFPKPFQVKHFKNDNSHTYPFVKIYQPDFRVQLISGGENISSYAWIDVLPMDGVVQSIRMRKVHFSIVKLFRYLFQMNIRDYQSPKNNDSRLPFILKRILKPGLYCFSKIFPASVLFNIMDQLAKFKEYDDSNYIGAFYSPYGVKASFNKDIYAQTLSVEFNGYAFDIPAGYDEFLIQQYGDYMAFPALEEREPSHIKVE